MGDGTIEFIARTRRQILAHGWTPNAPRCVLMSMERVDGDGAWSAAAIQGQKCLRDVVGATSIVDWNARQSSASDVVTVLGRCIETAFARACR